MNIESFCKVLDEIAKEYTNSYIELEKLASEFILTISDVKCEFIDKSRNCFAAGDAKKAYEYVELINCVTDIIKNFSVVLVGFEVEDECIEKNEKPKILNIGYKV